MKNDFAILWKLWTPQNFLDAHYCEECGLPTFEVQEVDEKGSDIWRYMCVYCEWRSDEKIILEQKVSRLERENSELRNALTCDIIHHTIPPDDVIYE